MTPLHQLEAQLRDMAKAEDEGHPPEPWEIRLRTLCLTCETPLSRRNRTGYCRRHVAAANARKPGWHEKQLAGVRRKIAHDPVYLESLRVRARAVSMIPEAVARRTRRFKELRVWEIGNAAQPKGSEPRQRAGRSISEHRMAWCPRELRPAYHELTSLGYKASEARRLVLDQHERDMARFRRELEAAAA